MHHFCVLFAGPIGSGKSQIAGYLSYHMALPIFSTDLIRLEVKADLLTNVVAEYKEEYIKRHDARFNQLIQSHQSFIYDRSIDRRWAITKEQLQAQGYETFIISLDFSLEKLKEIYQARGSVIDESLMRTYEEHQQFLEGHRSEIELCLDDAKFPGRMELTAERVKSIV